jgi:hypothetical protein
MGRRKARDHAVDGLPTKERPPSAKFGLEPMASFALPEPSRLTALPERTDALEDPGPTADRPSARGLADGPSAHSPNISPIHFNSWHVGQFAYGQSGQVACRICHVTFARGGEASHGMGRRHARESAWQASQEVPFCPGRAGIWGCHSFCRCGRFWPRGHGERPHLHFQKPEHVSRPDYEDEVVGVSWEQSHLKGKARGWRAIGSG